MKPRHFWTLYNAKAGPKKKSGLTRAEVKAMRRKLERAKLDAAGP